MSHRQAEEQAENAMHKKTPLNKHMQKETPFDDERCMKLFLTISCMHVFIRIMLVCRDNDGLSVQDDKAQLLDAGRSNTLPNQHLIGLRSTLRSGWRSRDSVIDIILTAWMNISWSRLMFSLCVLSPVYTSALPKWGCRLLLWGNFKFCSLVKNRTWLKSSIK